MRSERESLNILRNVYKNYHTEFECMGFSYSEKDDVYYANFKCKSCGHEQFSILTVCGNCKRIDKYLLKRYNR